MATIEELKELETPETPLFLFDCTLPSGDVQRWSTHRVTYGGNEYGARVLRHNLFELRSSADEATDGISKVTLTLANADSFLSSIERTIGWKGADITVQFLFMNLKSGVAATETQVVFRGKANPPEDSTESSLRLSFSNRLSLLRVFLPEVRIQKRCPWSFPTTSEQAALAIDGGARGKYSPFFRCGYSAGLLNGVGNLNGTTPFTSCDYTRTQCSERGMFDHDNSGHVTRRFGGLEFVPSSILVRGYGEKGSHIATAVDNQGRYNDLVPLIYGTAWYTPPVVFARNDGNLTRTEVLLGAGVMTSAVKVIVNGVEIPAGVPGTNMTATGWYNLVSAGTRSGHFNSDFTDASQQPLGDPYGSLAYLSVVVPNRISDGQSLPEIQVLAQGIQLSTFDQDGVPLGEIFTNNPAWVLLDLLLRSGWTTADIDLASFAMVAARCNELVHTVDLHGNDTLIPRFQCNLALTKRRSAADLVRGVRTAAGLYLGFGHTGLLKVGGEDTLSSQQPVKPASSNSKIILNGGWPAYEFGDGVFSGILRRENGQAAFRTWSRPSADSPNRFNVEFQDEFNEYQQDSLSLVDLDDALRCSQEVTASLTALGIPNFDQATRVTSLQLNKSVRGNVYVDFETSVRAVDLRPGDLITLSYGKEGWDRQPFRITRLAPGTNFRTASITAQLHNDDWYMISGSGTSGTGRQPNYGTGIPRALVGETIDEGGNAQFSVAETSSASTDGSITVQLAVGFVDPRKTLAQGLGIPLVSLNCEVDIAGGALTGGQTLYYGITAVDGSAGESALSFLVKASISAGSNLNAVNITKISLPATAASFHVYRGATPAQLLRIATGMALSNHFIDVGLPSQFLAPPDVNYDHSNFYWRVELQPEEPVTVHSPLTVGNTSLNMLANGYSKAVVRITKGTGAGQERLIAGNTATTLSVERRWDVEPNATSSFTVTESSWQFGASGVTSPVTFDIPNRQGTTIQISGRSANIRNDEAAYELSPLTRWRIVGSGGTLLDDDVPPAPSFGISSIGQGTIELQSIFFPTLNNTRTVSAATLTVGFWDELNTSRLPSLRTDLDTTATLVDFVTAINAKAGDLLQIGAEVLIVQESGTNALALIVDRGAYGSSATPHSASSPIYLLDRKTFVLPFARDFFGSQASGNYAFPAYLPDVRIATAEIFVTNSRGNSDVIRRSYTMTTHQGLRTLAGGQLSIQVEGMLAIQANAAPPLSVESARAVRDVYAAVRTASTGTPILLEVTHNGTVYCNLTIGVGNTVSDPVDGFALGPLAAQALIGLNIASVSQSADTLPGTDLTVTIRL